MPLDPVIAQGFRGIQLENPLDAYARVNQLQQSQQQNQLNALKMQEYQRDMQEQQEVKNRFARGERLDLPEMSNFLLASKTGREILKRQTDWQKTLTEEQARRVKLAADTEAAYRNMSNVIGNKQDAAEFLRQMVADPALKGSPIAIIPLERQIERIPEDPAQLNEWVKQFAIGSTKWMTENKPTTQLVKRGGQTDVIQSPGMGGTPTTVGTYADVPLPPAVEAQKVRLAQAGRSAGTTVVLPAQEKAFEAELGKEQAGKLVKDKVAAEDARSIISTIEEGRRLLNSGVITGFGAEFLTGLGAALNQAGVSFAEDSVANTQAFTANMAANVGRIIKQFGAGTGLSNADREYAEKMAGGKVSLDRKSIERILDINERMARNVISLHNRNAAKVKTNIPLTVEEPGRLSPQDQQALDWANSNPTDPRSTTIKQRLGAK